MDSTMQDLIPHLQLVDTFGALFIGVILAAVLFGITIVQVFVYFQTHSGTGITFYKLVVILLWTLDALHLALIIHIVYFYLVINHTTFGALTEIIWSCKLQSVVTVISIFVEHLLYVHRIWIGISPYQQISMTYAANLVSKGRSNVLLIALGITIILTSGLAIAIIWCTYQKVHVVADLSKFEWELCALYIYFGTVAFIDIFIALSLCYLLAMSRTGFSRTDLFITKLMIYIVNTGCLTSICSMAVVIACVVMPKNFIYEAVEFLLLKLYVNSYIALLNVRYYTQPHADTTHSSEYHMRHDVYRPRLHVRASQDEELQASRKSIFQHPDNEVLHITRPVQAVVASDCVSVDDVGGIRQIQCERGRRIRDRYEEERIGASTS
ncbi:hypothetical protein BD769DRAFT_1778575 [Suillus cothurnatus]|nr:hypothetical protein BD769DRAFT_1778575 [Suillus cothurnatus]